MPNSYIYPYDPTVMRIINDGSAALASVTVDFGKVLEFDICEMKSRLESVSNKNFRESELSVISSIESLVERISSRNPETTRAEEIFAYLRRMLHGKPSTFDEALQKILFFDALFWQAGHMHIGLGRLDLVLWPYYKEDIENGILTKETAESMITDFCLTLGAQTKAKSGMITGDTGQYILLGGINRDNVNVDNEVSGIFLDVFTKHHFPDPKLILRANADTSDEIWYKSVHCIATGNGSPLIMNETAIMSRMVTFGYSPDDVWNVGTSACWEPLIIGKSLDQNNPLPSVNLLSPLTQVLTNGNCPNNWNGIYSHYKQELNRQIHATAHDLHFDCSPLFSLFFDDCIKRGIDFTQGGAVYQYHGMQAVGLPNTVNALCNIRRKVFDTGIIPLEKLRMALLANFNGYEDVRQILLAGSDKFGKDDDAIVSMANDIMDYVNQCVQNIRINGEKVKIGFSSPNYVHRDNIGAASADGRMIGEPLAVHISPTSSDIDIAEVIDFASKLNYDGNRLNGNVVDFIVPTSYLNFPDKLSAILKDAVRKGVFELQLNVLDRATLVDAKEHPEKYPDLIVRVWGFSAYFNDLPEEYKDNLINRAAVYGRS